MGYCDHSRISIREMNMNRDLTGHHVNWGDTIYTTACYASIIRLINSNPNVYATIMLYCTSFMDLCTNSLLTHCDAMPSCCLVWCCCPKSNFIKRLKWFRRYIGNGLKGRAVGLSFLYSIRDIKMVHIWFLFFLLPFINRNLGQSDDLGEY